MSLILKVMFPTGLMQGNKSKMMKFEPSMTVEQVKKEIVESNQLDMSPNCLLFLPGSPTTKPRWPSTSATLSSLNLNTNVKFVFFTAVLILVGHCISAL